MVCRLLLVIPTAVSAASLEDMLQCVQSDFQACPHLQKIEVEMIIIFVPSLLALIAVSVVSVYAYKVQIREGFIKFSSIICYTCWTSPFTVWEMFLDFIKPNDKVI